jgi:RNA recognition motif-containing protein
MPRQDAARHEHNRGPLLPLAREEWRDFANKKEAKMNKNLYVGNLSQKVTEDDLRNNFSEAGAVASVSIIKDKFSGVSRGFGFVEMETEEGAQEAIKKFNGGDLDGKTITVNEARPKTESSGPRRDGGGRGPGGGGYRSGGGGGRSGAGGGGRRY